MKTKLFLIVSFLFMFALACNMEEMVPGVVDEASGIEQVTSRTAVDPIFVEDWTSGGGAGAECESASNYCSFEGCTNSFKFDEWWEDPMYEYSGPQAGTPITFGESGPGYFSWTSEYEVCAVIVKAGTGANVYCYAGSGYECGDGGPNTGFLVAPEGKDISHVTFCWSDVPCNVPPEKCYEEETAWADGPRYKEKGNWATYTPYPGEGVQVPIYAGQNYLAGYVSFTENGNYVNITVSLNPGFIFYYDMEDPTNMDENLKIQDYDVAPSGNPAPGQFDWKYYVPDGGTTFTTPDIPLEGFYGIHLDVLREVECE